MTTTESAIYMIDTTHSRIGFVARQDPRRHLWGDR